MRKLRAVSLLLLVLAGCGELNNVKVETDYISEGDRWNVKVEATVKAKSRQDALKQVTAILDAYSKVADSEPLKAEKEPEVKKAE